MFDFVCLLLVLDLLSPTFPGVFLVSFSICTRLLRRFRWQPIKTGRETRLRLPITLATGLLSTADVVVLRISWED